VVAPGLSNKGRYGYDSGGDQEPGRARVGGGEPKATILVSQGTYTPQEMPRWGATIGLVVIAHWARRRPSGYPSSASTEKVCGQ
jgi:hypothetical protein